MSAKYPLKLLLAEDNLMNQEVLSSILDALGYKVDIVNNGLEAVDAASTHNYDVIFMDVHMPTMDGLEASQRILKKLNPAPQIIAMTADIFPENLQKFQEKGIIDTVFKPVEIPDLIKALKRCYGRL
jgi:CheY-like chemotaxis protein